jgi:predicted CoA-substrate-specific enzyme activase
MGFDFGSVFTKAALLDEEGDVELCVYDKKGSGNARALEEFLDEVARRHPGAAFCTGIAGGGGVREGVVETNAIVALAAGVRRLHPDAQSIIEIGGHTSKFVVVGEDASVGTFATNDACAAGTGSFLEQQARRLNMDVAELARLSATAARDATIAGRCSVFAKSDMIHLQQKGTPVEEIAYGLCVAIARNALSTLLRGRDPVAPVIIAGGCARNAGILRAFTALLGALDAGTRGSCPPSLVPCRLPGLEGAVGAACRAASDGRPLAMAEIRRIAARSSAEGMSSRAFEPLGRPRTEAGAAEPSGTHDTPVEGWLGVDVGSVSTDFVVLDRGENVLSSIYLPTRGRPVDVLREGLAILKDRFRAGLSVLGCGVTGSGRHLAAKLLGADVVKNEITCQLLGAAHFVPDATSVIEIGGQDSKFIAIRDGRMSDFVMNKICAAGTGSFLEEQARDLGIDIYCDFARLALNAAAPLDLGSRCTVFMETEVVGAVYRGDSVADVCAGLAYSIVQNYLDKVVGRRPLGNRVVFQGGVASNAAVVVAFENVLGRPVHVHPFNRISGAIGAALAAHAALAQPSAVSHQPSAFAGLDPGPKPALKSFECRKCSNNCEVNMIESAGGRVYFGDVCERFTSGDSDPARSPNLPNLAAEYAERSQRYYKVPGAEGPTIGIPRASTLAAHLPFWATFFRELGFKPLLSENTSHDTLSRGLRNLPVSVCLPIKLAAGHVDSLVEAAADLVFVPSVVVLPGDVPSRSYSCPYAMAVPYMIGGKGGDRFVTPAVSFVDERAFAEGFEPWLARLGATKNRVCAAYRAARFVQDEFEQSLRGWTPELLSAGGYRHVFAVLGKPYNVFDAFMNLNLFERLRRMGVLAVPIAYLPDARQEGASDLPWRFSADIHRAAAATGAMDGVHPVIISNFGCGPDAFTFKQIEEALRGRPYLILEFDEHRGEAGLVTRLEAFVDRLTTNDQRPTTVGSMQTRRSVRVVSRESSVVSRPALSTQHSVPAPAFPEAPADVRIPYFADHAHAFAGLWRFKGHRASVLPLPDAETRLLGEKYSLGKECHAYSMIVGDVVKLARRDDGHEVYFYFPGTAIPCLLHQYGAGMRVLLRELAVENVKVCAPSGDELVSALGIEALERFYMGLLAIEILVKAVCEVRPYEKVRGTTDIVHRGNLSRIEDAIAGRDIVEALDRSLQAIALIPVEKTEARPVVGIAGDVYTKVNEAANSDLYRWLEDRGLEVWPSPFQIDLLDFGISRRFLESASRLKMQDLLLNGSVALKRLIDVWKINRVAAQRVARLEEPGYLEMKRLAAPYMPNEAHELLFLNTVKIVDFARRGAAGVVNAICFNCMVGNASAAVIEKIRRDHRDVPIVTAVYSGGEDPSRSMVLEAFVEQARDHHRRSWRNRVVS